MGAFAFPFLAGPFFGFFALLLEAGAFFCLAGAVLLELCSSFLLFAGTCFCFLAFALLAGPFFSLLALLFEAGAFFGFFAFLFEAGAFFCLAGAVLLELCSSSLLFATVRFRLFVMLLEAGACFRLFAFTLLAGASLGRPLPVFEFLF